MPIPNIITGSILKRLLKLQSYLTTVSPTRFVTISHETLSGVIEDLVTYRSKLESGNSEGNSSQEEKKYEDS